MSRDTERFYNKSGFEEDFISNERMKELASQQPLGVAIYSNWDCLNFYESGVVTESDCRCSDPNENDVNHAVTLVGYGKSD